MNNPSLIFAFFMFLVAATFFIIVPKQQYKECLIYGIIFGGLGDILTTTLLTFLHLIKYKNMGAFNVLDIFSSWTPVTWTYMYALFFYLLPDRKVYLVLYIIGFSVLTYSSGIVFQNFGIFEYIGSFKFAAPLIFLSWFSFAAWFYLRDKDIKIA